MAFVGTNYVRRGKVGNAKAKDNVRYIQHRTGKDKCSGLRTVQRGPANKAFVGPALCANTYARGPALCANGPTLVCKQLANRREGQHSLRMGERL